MLVFLAKLCNNAPCGLCLLSAAWLTSCELLGSYPQPHFASFTRGYYNMGVGSIFDTTYSRIC